MTLLTVHEYAAELRHRYGAANTPRSQQLRFRSEILISALVPYSLCTSSGVLCRSRGK